ncbi:MAG: hypothetical protein F4X36_05855 [Gammaproteobacteria bacterium]|nr:hypothetical protein [Gammaproteobacteria bacterium]
MTSLSRGRESRTHVAIRPDLPGADIVATGIEDLGRGEFTVEALLVAVGAPRLRGIGLEIPDAPGCPERPELALYAAIGEREADNTHSRYNALIRRLISFERAMEALHPLPIR